MLLMAILYWWYNLHSGEEDQLEWNKHSGGFTTTHVYTTSNSLLILSCRTYLSELDPGFLLLHATVSHKIVKYLPWENKKDNMRRERRLLQYVYVWIIVLQGGKEEGRKRYAYESTCTLTTQCLCGNTTRWWPTLLLSCRTQHPLSVATD